MAQDPYRYFRPEARNLLDQFAQGILELENNSGGAGAVQRLLRLAHTLKGAARVVRQSAIAEGAHAIEDVLAPYRDGTKGIARESIDAILTHLDNIGGQIVTLVPLDSAERVLDSETSSESMGNTDASAKAEFVMATPRVIHTDMADMEAVLDGLSETHAHLNVLRRNDVAIEQASHLADLLRAQLAPHGATDRNRTATPSPFQPFAIAEELHGKLRILAGSFDAAITRVDRELRQLRDTTEDLRLVSVNTVLMALKRTARDCARSLSKLVKFEATGGDIRLDADVLGLIQDALIQIVRNAVAHGIEMEGERVAAGKPASGTITVVVSRRGSKIHFDCHDDGRGIDLDAVRRAAVAHGLISATAPDSTTEELMHMLLQGGVSTSNAITDVSGRGVGLDVVRDALQRLGGEVSIRIDPGRGTTFALVIPKSVTAITALMVESETNGNVIAVPLDGVRRIVRLRPADIVCASTGVSILYDAEAIAFVPLAAVLDGADWSFARAWTALVVAGTDGLAAIGIERLVGTTRIVVRPLPDRLGINPIIAGAALDGEGNPQLIVDPDGLVAAAHGARAAEPNVRAAKRPVLVVDDSLTTRMLEKSILESAGYDVDVASSGEEALELARRKPFALFLCDVEMPGIDGFTFVERTRADATLREIPAILVSSRAAPEDRQRGRDAGAHGYIVKSEFNQAELLTMIGSMVG